MDAFGVQCRRDNPPVFNHTQNDNNAWWELDLGRVVDIDSILIWNRIDCCSNRIENYYVFVSDEPFNSKSLNNTINQSGVQVRRNTASPSPTMEITVGRTGRYVRVPLAGCNYLHMREVQVMRAELDTPLTVAPLASSPSAVGGDFTFNASAQGSGALSYQWNFGDGTADTEFTCSASVTHRYSTPGRYVVSLTVRDSSGDEVRETFTQIVHPALSATNSKSSSSVLIHSNGSQVWNVNPDNATVSVIDESALSLAAELPVGLLPVSVAEAPDGRVWVVNAVSASISVINASTLSVEQTIALPHASLPYGIVFDDSSAYVALEGTGEVIKLALNGAELARRDVGQNPRHLSIDSDGTTLYVSRFITPTLPGEDTANPVVEDASGPYGGEMLVLSTTDLSINDTVVLQHADKPASENEGPGIPNYLGALALSPDGRTGWLASKQDNILGGALRGGPGLAFDQTVRAITSKIDLQTNLEVNGDRVDHDNASVAGHAVFDPFGVTLFVSLEGNRQISVIDVSTAIEIGRFDTGRAPQGMAVSDDGSRLYVHNFMDRTVGVYDIDEIVQTGDANATELAVIDVVTSEQLDATVLRGKQLFYDARDDRLAGLDYMSCASCHENGGHDGRTWDFTGLGEKSPNSRKTVRSVAYFPTLSIHLTVASQALIQLRFA
jgi:YVTN family beta-propeller protein